MNTDLKSGRMKPGDRYIVKAGEFKGHIATIVDPVTFPDSDPRRRKLTVEVDGERCTSSPASFSPRST